MSWGQPWLLCGLLAPAVLLALAWRRGGSDAGRAGLARVGVVGSRLQPAGSSGTRRPWRLAAALAFALVALAQPRWGRTEQAGEEPAREILIALDLSRSMLVEDVAPSRLQRAHAIVNALLDGLHGERVGLIVFAGTAYVQVPLSSDYQILREFLPQLEPGYVPLGGTDYAGMLRVAGEGFSEDAASDRFLFVLSDGESTTPGWREELARLAQRGTMVVALGIGTTAGGDVPPATDGEKSPAQSRLEPATLQALAAGTQGIYRDAAQGLDVPGLLRATVEAGQRMRASKLRTEGQAERYAWFLAPALVLGLLGLWREVDVRPRARAIARSPVRGEFLSSALAGLAVLGLAFGPGGGPVRAHDEGYEFAPEATAADKLQWIVEDLAKHPTIHASDLALFAERTINYAIESRARGLPIAEGVVHDALEAVDRGEQMEPQPTDWDTLRSVLQWLLTRQAEELAAERPPEQKKEALDEEDRPSQTNGQGSQQTTSESLGQGGVTKTEAALGELRKDVARRFPGPRPPAAALRPSLGGGDEPAGAGASPDPMRALLLKRYREVVAGDTPGVVFQALQTNAPTGVPGGKDW